MIAYDLYSTTIISSICMFLYEISHPWVLWTIYIFTSKFYIIAFFLEEEGKERKQLIASGLLWENMISNLEQFLMIQIWPPSELCLNLRKCRKRFVALILLSFLFSFLLVYFLKHVIWVANGMGVCNSSFIRFFYLLKQGSNRWYSKVEKSVRSLRRGYHIMLLIVLSTG